MNDLSAYTWDQAHIMRFATARGFGAFEIPASTIRSWAAANLIHAVGKAPGGAHLYDIGEVSAAADRIRKKPGRKKMAS